MLSYWHRADQWLFCPTSSGSGQTARGSRRATVGRSQRTPMAGV